VAGVSETVVYALRQDSKESRALAAAAADKAQTAIHNEFLTRQRLDHFMGMSFLQRLRWLVLGY